MQSVRPNHGGEIAGHCHDAISRQDLVHGHATPRTPGMNARYECFHGTIQDAFFDCHEAVHALDSHPAFARLSGSLRHARRFGQIGRPPHPAIPDPSNRRTGFG
jgi:hypothetical protein